MSKKAFMAQVVATAKVHKDGPILDRNGQPINLIDPYEAAKLLAAYIKARSTHGTIPVFGAWKMHPAHTFTLAKECGGSPPSGWANFAGLMAGTPVCRVTGEGFEAAMPSDVVDALTREQFTKMAIESMTVRMAPPVTAAGCFLVTGLHPMPGIDVAHAVHEGVLVWSAPNSPESMARIMRSIAQDEKCLDVVHKAFFGMVLAILELFASLRPDRSYDSKALVGPIRAIAMYYRDLLFEASVRLKLPDLLLADPRVLDPAVFDTRIAEFIDYDLFDHFLCPAGLVLVDHKDKDRFIPRVEALKTEHLTVGYEFTDRKKCLANVIKGAS